MTLAREAIRLAREIGDPGVLGHVLKSTYWPLWVPEETDLRLAVSSEVLALAERTRDTHLALEARVFRLLALLEREDISVVRAEFTRCQCLAEELRQPYHLWLVGTVEACLAFAEDGLATWNP